MAVEMDQSKATVLPYTGEEYLESLKDGRNVWINGEKVDDVTTHPAFRNTARTIADLYDSLHDPARNQRIVGPTDTGNGGYTHKFFVTPRSVEDLVGAKEAITEWARMTYGWLGRCPDYKASFLATLGANSAFYGEYEDNAKRWYKEGQERLHFFTQSIVNPPVDRDKGLEGVKDVYLRVVDETDEGLVVSGAKVVATFAPLTHYNFVAHYGPQPIATKEYSGIYLLPINSPGLKIICRSSYEESAARRGRPFDYPLSSRLDENDAIFVFDRALIPWENVFMYGDVEGANNFFPASGFIERFCLHGCIRIAVKLEFLAGLMLKGVEATGAKDFRGVQARIGEILAWRSVFWGLVDAMVHQPKEWVNGALLPNLDYGMAYRVFATIAYPRVAEIIQQDLGSALIFLPSHAHDLEVPEIRGYLDTYLRGSNGYNAEDRIKLMKLIWDAIGTEFGGRNELYERNYAGNHENIRMEVLFAQTHSGLVEQFMGLADQCLSDYDVSGWTAAHLRD